MIDFKNKALFKLKQEKNQTAYEVLGDSLIEGEEVFASFVSMRDRVIFTNRRIIAVNVQGLTGSKVDYTSIPYKKIQMYSVETAGTIDIDSELDIVMSGMGTMRFEFIGGTDIKGISKLISNFVLA